MIQLQLVIEITEEKVSVNSNILAREDARDDERSLAVAIENLIAALWIHKVGGKVTRLGEDEEE